MITIHKIWTSTFTCATGMAILIGGIGCPSALAQRTMNMNFYPPYVLNQINMSRTQGLLNEAEANSLRAQHKLLSQQQAQTQRRHNGFTRSDQRILRTRWQELYDRINFTAGHAQTPIGF